MKVLDETIIKFQEDEQKALEEIAKQKQKAIQQISKAKMDTGKNVDCQVVMSNLDEANKEIVDLISADADVLNPSGPGCTQRPFRIYTLPLMSQVSGIPVRIDCNRQVEFKPVSPEQRIQILNDLPLRNS